MSFIAIQFGLAKSKVTPAKTHVQMALIGLCICVSCMLASCQKPVDQLSNASSFANEPFPVRLVDRNKFDESFQPAQVEYSTDKAPGTIIIDTRAKYLYMVRGEGMALRFGIAVGAAGKAWKGTATVGRKSKWPAWYPTDEMKKVARGIPARIPPGDDNPLGARALYLYQGSHDTLYRIHGTSEPWTIGTEASSGCIRMLNEDIIALYDKVQVGTEVVVR